MWSSVPLTTSAVMWLENSPLKLFDSSVLGSQASCSVAGEKRAQEDGCSPCWECFTAYLIQSRWCSLNMHALAIILEITSPLKRSGCNKCACRFFAHYNVWCSFMCDHGRANTPHPSEVSPASPSSHNLSEILTDKGDAIWSSQVRGFIFCPLIKDKNLFCTWGRSVQSCTCCTGPLAPVLLVTLLRGRAAAVVSQSSITVSSGCGRRKRAMSSNPIYQPPEAARQSSSW